jgi:iron complex outermembrane receptor protein
VSKVLHLVEKPVVAYYGYSECCASGSSLDVKRGQASINIQNRFNKTFEHTLNYNNDLSDNFNLDALVGYSYYDTADGSFSSEKVMIALKQI